MNKQNAKRRGPARSCSRGRRRRNVWGVLLLVCGIWLSDGCATAAGERTDTSQKLSAFVSQNFFSIDYPSDWTARDLDDGANLFFADELIYVRIKIFDPPDSRSIPDFVSDKVKADADMQGGQATLMRVGYKGPHPFSSYLITKPTGQRLQETLIYNNDLKLLYVLQGSSRPEDFDEFTRIFESMLQSFQFRVTARIPPAEGEKYEPDFSRLSGAWVAYLNGLQSNNYVLLQKSCAAINGSRIIDENNVRRVRGHYFPYESPVYTFVSHVEVRDKIARARITVRALPPEGFLMHETREFILEDGYWRVLRFDKVD